MSKQNLASQGAGNIIIKVAKVFSGVVLASGFITIVFTTYLVGFVKGYGTGWNSAERELQKYLSDKVSSTTAPAASQRPVAQPVIVRPTNPPVWGGPQLWDAVNKRRVQLGVNPLSIKEEICTIASIRLNQQLDLGKLDGHVGFSNMPTSRPDLKWIFEKYNLSEFLVSGASTPQNAVDMWENTLGHKELLSGGQYVWGCIYAQNGFGVAIAAY